MTSKARILQLVREVCDHDDADNWRELEAAVDAALVTPVVVGIVDEGPVSQQTARYAIDGAVTKGLLGVAPPPSDHWLHEYWAMGAMLQEEETA